MKSNDWPPLRLELQKVIVMRKTRTSTILLAALLATGCVGSPHLAYSQAATPAMSRAPETPEAFLGKIYKHYGNGQSGINLANPRLANRIFDQSILALLNDKRWNQEGAINFDFFCVCNDFDNLSDPLVVAKAQSNSNHITANVNFNNNGKIQKVVYELVPVGTQLRVYNIIGTNFNLREFLSAGPQ